jgi:phytoene dehydrogenase-like protein
MGKKVLVIGAGIAGLSAASYLQRNGFETEIFELHALPGGLCTAWKREGFAFDACIHWLMGSSPASNLHEIWKELGAGGLKYLEWEVYTRVLLSGGDSFDVFTDPEALEAEMLRLGPEDGKVARIISTNVRRVSRIDMPAAFDKLRPGRLLSLLANMPAAIPLFGKWMKTPLSELLAGLRSPKLKEAFSLLYGDSLPDFPAAGLFMMLGFMAKRSCGYPIGGSLAFARAIEEKYISLGGAIRYGLKVDEIIVEGGKAVGLRGAGGEARGDIVVSAADGFDTVRRLLGGRYSNSDLEAAFAGGKRFPSLIYIGLGLGESRPSLPHSSTFRLGSPITLEEGALVKDSLSLRVFGFDPGLAPKGKCSASVMIETTNDAYWSGLRERDRGAYEAEKKAVADKVVAVLDAVYPGLGSSVEIVDVATPATFIRYTNNWHGSYEGWLPTRDFLSKKMAKTLAGLANFHMVGQWVNPGGGLPPCGIDGRALAKRLCKAEGIRFRPD